MSGSFVTHYVQEDEHSPVENSPPFAHIQAPCKAASPSPVPTILYDSIQSSPGKDTVPARQIVPPRLTDHTYHDYASEICQYPITKKSKSNFPAKLHRMISDPANSQIIQWQPHGRGKSLMLICDRLICLCHCENSVVYLLAELYSKHGRSLTKSHS